MGEKNSCCSYCGNPFVTGAPWPRHCQTCHRTSYLNPLPVVVIVVPVSAGIVVIRRNIPPQRGTLTLPGGYIDRGESWQDAGAREVQEETGITIDSKKIRLLDVMNGLDDTLIVFGLADPVPESAVQAFSSPETQEVVVIERPIELGFVMHSRIVERYFREWRAAQKRKPGGVSGGTQAGSR